jgi:hypothetical protein
MTDEASLPVPETPEQMREIAARKAEFRAKVAQLRNGEAPLEADDDLRPMDFEAVVRRLQETRARSQVVASTERLEQDDRVAARAAWLLGKNQHGLDRIVGMPEADIRLACSSVGKAPRLPWHTGTMRAADAAERFMDSIRDFPRRRGDHHTLLLYGGNGLGKSLMMAWVFAEHLHGEWLRPEDIAPGFEWDARRRSLMEGHIVYVDDLGREGSPFAIQQIGLILERRHDAGRPTVITTNFLMAPEQRAKVPADLRVHYKVGDTVTERYGGRLHSRLMNGRTIFAWLGGNDLRQTTRR